MKRRLVGLLVGLYPEPWRSQYGPEIEDVLLRRPLGVREFADVAGNVVWQNLRLQEPWVLLAVPLLVWELVFLAVSFGGGVLPLQSVSAWWSTIVFFATGFWTVVRSGEGGGRAAAKLNLLLGLPFLIVGILGAVGAVRFVVLGPYQAVEPADWRIALTFYSSRRVTGLVVAQMFFWAPLFQVPVAALIGWFGGLAGRLMRRRPARTA